MLRGAGGPAVKVIEMNETRLCALKETSICTNGIAHREVESAVQCKLPAHFRPSQPNLSASISQSGSAPTRPTLLKPAVTKGSNRSNSFSTVLRLPPKLDATGAFEAAPSSPPVMPLSESEESSSTMAGMTLFRRDDLENFDGLVDDILREAGAGFAADVRVGVSLVE